MLHLTPERYPCHPALWGLLMLGAGPGSTIVIETEGPQAEEALDALTGLVEAGFHEEE